VRLYLKSREARDRCPRRPSRLPLFEACTLRQKMPRHRSLHHRYGRGASGIPSIRVQSGRQPLPLIRRGCYSAELPQDNNRQARQGKRRTPGLRPDEVHLLMDAGRRRTRYRATSCGPCVSCSGRAQAGRSCSSPSGGALHHGRLRQDGPGGWRSGRARLQGPHPCAASRLRLRAPNTGHDIRGNPNAISRTSCGPHRICPSGPLQRRSTNAASVR
jgi:hypothetical protein